MKPLILTTEGRPGRYPSRHHPGVRVRYNRQADKTVWTIRPGQEFYADTGYRQTDEGNHREWIQAQWENNHWTISNGSSGRDCDGRYSDWNECRSTGGRQAPIWVNGGKFDWAGNRNQHAIRVLRDSPMRRTDAGQRDYTAEAAGY